MTYKEIEEISTYIVENEIINNNDLILLYELSEKKHYTLDHELFKLFSKGKFIHKEEIFIVINGVSFKFIKKV